MIRIELNIVINRSIGEVFEFLANPENNPKWNPLVKEAEITSEGPIGVGTIAITVAQNFGRRFDN